MTSPLRFALVLAATLSIAAARAQTPPPADPAPAPAPPAPPPAAVAPAPAPAMVPIARDTASTILGRPVLDGQGQAAGSITDVLVDATGVVRAAVVDFGGFLGVGQRRIAVAWAALRFDPSTGAIRLLMSAPELAPTPEYKPGAPSNTVATPPRDILRPTEKPPADKPAPDEAPAH